MSVQDRTVTWIAGGPGTLSSPLIWARRDGHDGMHDEKECQRISDHPDLHCGQVATIREARVDSAGDMHLTWRASPYCRTRADRSTQGEARCFSLGWNVVVTLERGQRAVVMLRSERTLMGGLWSVSANETACPEDMPSTLDHSLVDLSRPKGRSISEELGITASRAEIEASSRLVGMFKYGDGYGVLTTVDADRHGLSEERIKELQRGAQGSWEGRIEVMGLDRIRRSRRAWTPWAKECIEAAARMTQRASVSMEGDDA